MLLLVNSKTFLCLNFSFKYDLKYHVLHLYQPQAANLVLLSDPSLTCLADPMITDCKSQSLEERDPDHKRTSAAGWLADWLVQETIISLISCCWTSFFSSAAALKWGPFRNQPRAGRGQMDKTTRQRTNEQDHRHQNQTAACHRHLRVRVRSRLQSGHL